MSFIMRLSTSIGDASVGPWAMSVDGESFPCESKRFTFQRDKAHRFPSLMEARTTMYRFDPSAFRVRWFLDESEPGETEVMDVFYYTIEPVNDEA